MRPSKSRSRNKTNRNRSNTVGNVVNRVFDSSGPEGKVRGTPQQIIEKYNQLARDAQLANDRVATENFQQHAEHYLRLLGEAQKEIDAKRDQQERENRERQNERDRERPQRDHDSADAGDSPQPDVLAGASDEGETSTLVETPESKPAPKRAPRKPRQKAIPEQEASKDGDAEEAAPEPAPPPRPRRPRKPKAEAEQQEAKREGSQKDHTKPSDAAAE